jgi:hypothetical protein
MENISRGSYLRGFCHYPHRGSVQDITVARSSVIFTAATAMTRNFFVQCYCVHREVVHCTVSINNSDSCRHSKGRIYIIQQLLRHLGTAIRVRGYRLPSIKRNVLHKSLYQGSQYITWATLEGRGSWVISIYLWDPSIPIGTDPLIMKCN